MNFHSVRKFNRGFQVLCSPKYSQSTSNHIPKKKLYFSGIQPTGEVHLGNYLGAIQNWTRLQNSLAPGDEALFSVVDLHSITTSAGRQNLRLNTFRIAAVLLACGLDPEKSIIFVQSRVSGHSQLHWLLSCLTPMFMLNNMTQYKDKVRQSHEPNLGLYAYPVLMAADILLYGTTHVPVGDDQDQHMQLARALAKKANLHWNTDHFIEPEMVTTRFSRVMSLTDSTKKMSKSDTKESSKLSLFDSPDVLAEKIKRAKTDSIDGVSYDETLRPEVANLINIFSAMAGRPNEDICAEFVRSNMLEFKLALTDVVISGLKPIYENLTRYEQDRAYVESVLEEGARKANAIAEENLRRINDILGAL